MTATTKLTGLELRAAVATRVMRYRWVFTDGLWVLYGPEEALKFIPGMLKSKCDLAIDEHGKFCGRIALRDCPCYESSLDASRLVLEEIERRGLFLEFRRCLRDALFNSLNEERGGSLLVGILIGLKVTPEKICHAALAVVEDTE